ncbi:MAG TPA: type III-A CRISPR-associated protein Cas10/Csm1 [Methanospirillum sp.]|nr:type III-A CRISPR-associated protein Cas10/Csm1 [Methanospirillum sp.]
MEPDTRTVVVAALLHDIGKFMQRAGISHASRYEQLTRDDFGWTGAHAKWSADFVHTYLGDEEIADIVLCHHRPEESASRHIAEIVRDADHLSSAIDRKGRADIGKVQEEPLKAVFPAILKKEGTKDEKTADMYYQLKPLGIGDETFPVKRQEIVLWKLDPAYKALWDQFTAECKNIPRNLPVQTLLALLRKYTSCIPSAVYKNEPDIPLFDHATTTAAVAQCLHQGDKTTPFILVQGDLSGIQNFIFQTVVPEQARKGTAKRLRGRSFWLTLLMDAICEEIKEQCGLFETSVLWNTGGKFLILVPNTGKNQTRIETISRKVNELLLRRHGGNLSISIAMLKATADEIKTFSATLDRLASLSAAKKKQKFLECGLSFEVTGIERPLSQYCSVCGVLMSGDECRVCSGYRDIGTKIARAQWLIRGKNLPIHFSDLGLAASYDLLSREPAPGDYEVYSINDTNMPVKNPGGCGFLFLGNTVPMDHHDILSFSEMAQLAPGAARLGYIKADVDNLGKIFARGLPDTDRTISRIHTLSSQLQYFFAGYLNTICREFMVYSDLCSRCKDKNPKQILVKSTDEDGDETRATSQMYYDLPDVCNSCKEKYGVSKFYITYSGGDDLLIIGPWDDAIRLADLIHQEFVRFTGDNPNITLSAGIAMVSHRLPVSRAVQIAEELLEQAKSWKAGGIEKNRVAVFDECLPWGSGTGEQGLHSLIPLAERLMEAVRDQEVSKSMVYSLLTLWEQTFWDCAEKEPVEETQTRLTRRRFMPNLRYLMKRNIRPSSLTAMEELIVQPFPWIKLPVYWTSLALRNDGKTRKDQIKT